MVGRRSGTTSSGFRPKTAEIVRLDEVGQSLEEDEDDDDVDDDDGDDDDEVLAGAALDFVDEPLSEPDDPEEPDESDEPVELDVSEEPDDEPSDPDAPVEEEVDEAGVVEDVLGRLSVL